MTWHDEIDIDNAFSIKDYVDNVIAAYEHYRFRSSGVVTLTISGWLNDEHTAFAATGPMLVTIDGKTFTIQELAIRYDDTLQPMNYSNVRHICGWTYPSIFSITVNTNAEPYHITINLKPSYDEDFEDYITYDQRNYSNTSYWHCWDWKI